MLRISGLSLLTLLALTACGAEPTERVESVSGLVAVDPNAEAELLVWRDLLPDSDLEALEALTEGRADPSLMSQLGEQSTIEGQIGTFNIVEDLDGLVVRMPGYILPSISPRTGQRKNSCCCPITARACMSRRRRPIRSCICARWSPSVSTACGSRSGWKAAWRSNAWTPTSPPPPIPWWCVRSNPIRCARPLEPSAGGRKRPS
jgi:hypothetical protein